MTPNLMQPIDGEILPPGRGMVRVASRPKAFRMDCVTMELPAGTTLDEMVAVAIPAQALREFAGVHIAGHEVPRENWRRVRPKPGTLVEIVAGVAGGGGGGDDGSKSPLRTVLTIAVMVAAAYVGGPAGIAALGQFGASAAAIGVPIAGGLIANAVKAPARP